MNKWEMIRGSGFTYEFQYWENGRETGTSMTLYAKTAREAVTMLNRILNSKAEIVCNYEDWD